jgi:predicted 3-demethylubiquinone-9 3-methyltransferase (glyoxalase superfamily)
MKTMQKITPHLWFDTEAIKAAEFYVSVFGKNSGVKNINTLHDTPSGSVDVVSFELAGQAFEAMSAGPLFKFNPSVSFQVRCNSKTEVQAIWDKLSRDGTVLMEWGAYPFSELYGWVQDTFGYPGSRSTPRG